MVLFHLDLLLVVLVVVVLVQVVALVDLPFLGSAVFVTSLPCVPLSSSSAAAGMAANHWRSFQYQDRHHYYHHSLQATTTESVEEDSTVSNPLDSGVESIIEAFLTSFESAWTSRSGTELVDKYFLDQDKNDKTDERITPFWRDMVAYTWNIVTHEGRDDIRTALDQPGIVRYRAGSSFRRTDRPLPPRRYHHHQETNSHDEEVVIEFWADLTIASVGTGKVHFKLLRLPSSTTSGGTSDWKIHTLLTTLMELSQRPFRVGVNRIRGHEPGAIFNRQYWPERLEEQQQQYQQHDHSFVVIIGGGQAGLSLGARLHLLEIPYTILEAGEKPGTAWRKRYPSLHLHDPVWYNHMPYLPFPETWPVFCPRDKIADWLEFYSKALDLNVQTQCRVTKVEQEVMDTTTTTTTNDALWNVMVSCIDEHGKPQSRTIVTKNVVFATGNSSKPRIPKNIPGLFMGLQIHSSQYRGGRSYRGKRVIVVGSNNSGWDIVQDLWEQGASHVTMIQRSPSMVVSTTSVLAHGLGSLYRQDAPLPHEDADLVATSVPYKMLLPRWKGVAKLMKETDKDLLENLARAGYQLDDGPDDAGIFAKSASEGGGFYIDMGCAELVSRNKVDVRYATVERLESDGLVIRDKKTNSETFLSADVIVYATGFETMDQWVAQLCGDGVAKSVGRTWGLGLGTHRKDPGPWEGELRNMWKPTTARGLWFHGGNLAQARHYSRFLALQLAARYCKLDTHIYGIPSPTQPTVERGPVI